MQRNISRIGYIKQVKEGGRAAKAAAEKAQAARAYKGAHIGGKKPKRAYSLTKGEEQEASSGRADEIAIRATPPPSPRRPI